MDLLIKDLNSGFLPKNYRKNTFHSLPSNMQEDLDESLSEVDNIIKGVFVNSNEQLFNSFVSILKSHLSWYDLGGLKEPENRFEFILSKFNHYYFCPDGIVFRLMVRLLFFPIAMLLESLYLGFMNLRVLANQGH